MLLFCVMAKSLILNNEKGNWIRKFSLLIVKIYFAIDL
ncbi:hypothetical protein BN891_2520 [Bacteroides xylanisolvens SD CC 2a]|nr:hypothetical protein BN891_2520 [Bacteroides xylanisolvens SD CC 2a]